MNYLYLDTEFSNFSVAKGDLIQLAVIAVKDGEEVARFNEVTKPVKRNGWNLEAEKVHGISWHRAQGFQDISKMKEKFQRFVSDLDDRFVVCAWNHRNDKLYVQDMLGVDSLLWHRTVRSQWLDIFTEVKNRKSQIQTKNYKIETVAKFFDININAHDAMSDALSMWKIHEYIMGLQDPGDFKHINLEKLSELEKKEKYLDRKYLQINGDGSVYISEDCTQNKEALRIILTELWEVFIK